MTYVVDLAPQVEKALAEMPEDGRQEVLQTIAAALVRRDMWPTLGGWDGALWFGLRSWVVFVAYADGVDVLDLGWVG